MFDTWCVELEIRLAVLERGNWMELRDKGVNN